MGIGGASGKLTVGVRAGADWGWGEARATGTHGGNTGKISFLRGDELDAVRGPWTAAQTQDSACSTHGIGYNHCRNPRWSPGEKLLRTPKAPRSGTPGALQGRHRRREAKCRSKDRRSETKRVDVP